MKEVIKIPTSTEKPIVEDYITKKLIEKGWSFILAEESELNIHLPLSPNSAASPRYWLLGLTC